MANPQHLTNFMSMDWSRWNGWKGNLLESEQIDLSNVDFNEEFRIRAEKRDNRVIERVDLSGVNLKGANFKSFRLYKINFDNTDLTGSNLFKSSVEDTSFKESNLNGCDFRRATLRSPVDFSGADISGARFERSEWHKVTFENVQNVHKAHGLTSVALDEDEQTKDFALANPSEFLRKRNWSWVRKFGSLPFFQVSAILLIILPIMILLIGRTNDLTDSVKSSLKTISEDKGEPLERLAASLNERIPLIKIRLDVVALLMGTVFLFSASTVYSLSCPDEVREFTQARWVHELGKPLLHYQYLTWLYPKLRIACITLYAAGFLFVVPAIIYKFITIAIYVWRY